MKRNEIHKDIKGIERIKCLLIDKNAEVKEVIDLFELHNEPISAEILRNIDDNFIRERFNKELYKVKQMFGVEQFAFSEDDEQLKMYQRIANSKVQHLYKGMKLYQHNSDFMKYVIINKDSITLDIDKIEKDNTYYTETDKQNTLLSKINNLISIMNEINIDPYKLSNIVYKEDNKFIINPNRFKHFAE